MYKFDKLIKEALSFNKTFKAPDAEDILQRRKEVIDIILSKIKEKTQLEDGSWHIQTSLVLTDYQRYFKNLKSLEDFNISKVDGGFWCHNLGLTSLKGCPREVGGTFDCSKNLLTTLEGCPIKAGENFFCSINNIISLKGCPEIINGVFDCSHNQLYTLDNCPKETKGDFWCYDNPEEFTIEYVETLCDVHGRIYVEL